MSSVMANERCACNRPVTYRAVLRDDNFSSLPHMIIVMPGGEKVDLQPYWQYSVRMGNRYENIYYACERCIGNNHRFFQRC